MGIIKFSLERRVTIAMAAIAVSMFGAVAFSRLPINLLPDISYPSLTIESRFSGAAPAEVEALLTRPVEEAVGVVAGVQRITSVSRPGLSQVTLEFGWGRNMDFAALDVRQKLDLLALPREASKPVLLRFDPANDPIMRLYLTGSDDLFQLRYLGEEVLKKDLESTEGYRRDQGQWRLRGGDPGARSTSASSLVARASTISGGQRPDWLARTSTRRAAALYEREARYLVRSTQRVPGPRRHPRDHSCLTREAAATSSVADVADGRSAGTSQREVITRYGGVQVDEDGEEQRLADREAVELAHLQGR